MRLLLAFFIVFALGLGWFFYLEHDTSKFIKNLPEPPTSIEETKVVPPEEPSVFSIEAPSRSKLIDEVKNIKETPETPHLHSHPHSHEVPEQVHDVKTYTDVPPNDVKENSETAALPPLEGLKARLLKKHGDIPEIHKYIELRRKRLNREQLTMAEALALSELLYYFNPTERNRKSLELRRRLSAVADPTYFSTEYDEDRARQQEDATGEVTIKH